MCCNKNRAPRANYGCGRQRACERRPTLARMIVEHIVAKREEKKALAAGRQPVQEPVAYREPVMKRDVNESGWVDEKQKIQLHEQRNVSRETLGTELLSYTQVMKGA